MCKMKMTLPQFQKEPFLPIPNHFQSQTQGSFCDVGNCQTHVGADGRVLPVALALLKHFCSLTFNSRLDFFDRNCNGVISTRIKSQFIQFDYFHHQ